MGSSLDGTVVPIARNRRGWQEGDAVPTRLFAVPVRHQMRRHTPSRDKQQG